MAPEHSDVPLQYYIFETYAPAGTNPPHAVTAVTAKVVTHILLRRRVIAQGIQILT